MNMIDGLSSGLWVSLGVKSLRVGWRDRQHGHPSAVTHKLAICTPVQHLRGWVVRVGRRGRFVVRGGYSSPQSRSRG